MRDRIRRARAWWAELQKQRRRRGWTLPFDLGSSATRMVAVLLLFLVGLAGLFTWSLRSLDPVATGRDTSLGEVIRQASAGQVGAVTLHDRDHRMTGRLKSGQA
ncbi:MAG TPA: hypothetical protein VGO92_06920, partial [Acidimicrobiales bacterium]|nr:hypothetical protein [Acidimicrobiales bacterium]